METKPAMNRRDFLENLVGIGVSASTLPGLANLITKVQPFCVTAPILHLDKVNGNGRMYTSSVARNVIKRFRALPPRTLMGELGKRSDIIIRLAQVSHVVTDLKIDNGYLMADIEVLDTPHGRILKNLLQESQVVFRTAGMTKTYCMCTKEEIYAVPDCYKLVTVDALPLHEAVALSVGA